MANPDALTFNEYQKTHRFTAGITSKMDIAAGQELLFGAYSRDTRYRESVPSTIQLRSIHTPGISWQYNLTFKKGSIKNHFSAGIDYQWQSIDEHRHPNLGKAVAGAEIVSLETISQKAAGVYLLDRVELGHKWGMVISLRHDVMDNELEDKLKTGGRDLSGSATFRQNSGRVGLTWNPASEVGVYTNWGTGFLPPSTEELANNPDDLGGFNQRLVPATSSGEEIGLRGILSRTFFYDVAMFYLRTENDFGRYRIASRPLETFYRNVGASNRYGLETLLTWLPLKAAEIKVAYTYSHLKYSSIMSMTSDSELSGTFLPNSPAHQAFFDIQSSLSSHWLVGLSLEMQSRATIDATNSVWIDGYTLVHARTSYHLAIGGVSVEFTISGRNIFGVEYIAFTEPDPDGNSYQPAATAEYIAGLRIYLPGK